MKKIMISAAMTAVMSATLFAGNEFSLNGVSARGFDALPVPLVAATGPVDKSAVLPPGLDISLQLPFSALNRKLAEVTGTAMETVDPTRPVLSRSGEFLRLENMLFNLDGVEIVPVVILKPWFEGRNMLAIKVASIEADVAFGPNKAMPELDKNELMAFAFDKITTSILAAMDKALAKKNVAMRGADILAFNYDKPSWTLHVAINPAFIAPLMPGLVRDISLTHFGMNDEGFTLSMKSGTAVDLSNKAGYNLALSDGLLTTFLAGYTAGSDFDIAPAGHDGGVKFRADGVMEFAGKIHARDFFLKPNVYFSAKIKPQVTADNTIVVKVQSVDLDKAYGIGVPGFLNNWLQGKIVSSVVDTILTTESLKKIMTASKVSKDTVKLTLKDTAVLPSFAQGMQIRGLNIGSGVLYLSFSL